MATTPAATSYGTKRLSARMSAKGEKAPDAEEGKVVGGYLMTPTRYALRKKTEAFKHKKDYIR
ncbi:hypothetical protein GCM10023226_41170 [Nocardioides nanhaiensis]|uniref:Uncharacterized protein n=1 Tax=Nocardioides nanhaiensis TaxID=1476871 RepID=A0ABP8X2W2_9ACTN